MSMVQTQRRVGMGGVEGLDAPACLMLLEAQGMDRTIAALFLPYWEQGLLQAIDENRQAREGQRD